MCIGVAAAEPTVDRDFAQEINALIAPAVPQEVWQALAPDNAWAGWLPLIETLPRDEARVRRLAKLIGVEPPVAEAPRLIDWQDWARDHLPADVTTARPIKDDQAAEDHGEPEGFGDDWFQPFEPAPATVWYDAASRGPWTLAKYPEIAHWLDAQRPLLDSVASSAARSHVVLPVLPDEAFLNQAWMPPKLGGELLRWSEAITVRAYGAWGAGDWPAVSEDLGLLIDLADAVETQPRMIHRLIALSIDAHRLELIRRAVVSGELPNAVAETWLIEGLAGARDGLQHSDALNTGERFDALDVLDGLHRRRSPDHPDGALPPEALAWWQAKFDAKLAAELMTEFHAAVADAAVTLDPTERQAKLNALEAGLDPMIYLGFALDLLHLDQEPGQVYDLLGAFIPKHGPTKLRITLSGMYATMDRERFTAAVTGQLIRTLFPSYVAGLRAERQHDALAGLTEVGVAVWAYGAEHGRFPVTLKPLAPRWGDARPVDIDGLPFRYRVDADGLGFTLYAIGRNGIDDGGVGDVSEPNAFEDRDIVMRCRLRDATPP